LANGYLDKAIATYLMGYKADMRILSGSKRSQSLIYKKGSIAADLAKVVEFSVNTYLEKSKNRSGISPAILTITGLMPLYWNWR
jgi:hypothetical protein